MYEQTSNPFCRKSEIFIARLMLKYLENAQLSERPLLMLSVLLIVIGFQFVSMGLLAEMIAYRDVQDQKIDQFIELLID